MRRWSRDELVAGIRAKDRNALARAITLAESERADHRALASEVIAAFPAHLRTRRLGISGTPGVGKSTFIESFGLALCGAGASVAVLAVDPTSVVSGGSILGDKTRMEELVRHPQAFIRPSPSGGTLGGVARRTREAILLCEAFGFDYVLVETVGVGQSEVAVSRLTDCFLMLLQPGAGDDLQGIKRGILELVDLVVVTKADGANKALADAATHHYRQALHILRTEEHPPAVLACSALERSGLSEIKETIDLFYRRRAPELAQRRQVQQRHFFDELLLEGLRAWFGQRVGEDVIEAQRAAIGSGESSIEQGLEALLGKLAP